MRNYRQYLVLFPLPLLLGEKKVSSSNELSTSSCAYSKAQIFWNLFFFIIIKKGKRSSPSSLPIFKTPLIKVCVRVCVQRLRVTFEGVFFFLLLGSGGLMLRKRSWAQDPHTFNTDKSEAAAAAASSSSSSFPPFLRSFSNFFSCPAQSERESCGPGRSIFSQPSLYKPFHLF